MTDYPPDLIETLAKASPTASRVVLGGEYGVRMHSDEEAARIVLDALASRCDGDLFDPATGQRVTADEWTMWCNTHGQPASYEEGLWCCVDSYTSSCELLEPLFTLTRKDQS